MKQAFTNTKAGKYAGKAMVAGKAAAKLGRASGRRQQTMPVCSFGAACKRKGCVYRHENVAVSNEVCKAFLGYVCDYGRGCFKRHPGKEEAEQLRKKYKRTICMWGDGCDTPGCLYYHTWDAEFPTTDVQNVSVPGKELEHSEGVKESSAQETQATTPGEQGVIDETAPQGPSEWAPNTTAPPGVCDPVAFAGHGYIPYAAPEYQYRPHVHPGTSQVPCVMPEYAYPPNVAMDGEWTPQHAAGEKWVPNAAASGGTPNAAASEWTPNAAASEWTPNAAASEWTPNAAASEWTPNAAAPTWAPSSDLADNLTH